MGMSTHVIGFRPPDRKWKNMKDVWNVCEAAGINPPTEVEEFFGFETPDDNGVEVDLPTTEWSDRVRQGFELNVKDIPKDITVIRFFNSY